MLAAATGLAALALLALELLAIFQVVPPAVPAARLYLAGRSSRRGFWRLFAGVSTALLLWALALSVALVKYSVGSR